MRPRTIAGMTWRLLRRSCSRRHALGAGAVLAGAIALGWCRADSKRRRREHHDELEELDGVDCPTPRCTREARGTGFMELFPDEAWRDPDTGVERRGKWYVEFACPRCGEVFNRWTLDLQRLCERLADRRGCG